VQVKSDDSFRTGNCQQIRYQFGTDRYPWSDFLILAGIPVVRQNGRDPFGRRTVAGVDHQQQFDEVIVDRRAGGLNDKNVSQPDVFVDLYLYLAVAERLHLGTAKRLVEILADFL
jgi:hypothetical protein